jgi:hypothetical protein
MESSSRTADKNHAQTRTHGHTQRLKNKKAARNQVSGKVVNGNGEKSCPAMFGGGHDALTLR